MQSAKCQVPSSTEYKVQSTARQ